MAKRMTTVNGTADNDTLYGETGGEFGMQHGRGAGQVINGLDGDDWLYGDAQSMVNRATGGNDSLNGGAGTNVLFGDAYDLANSAKGGNDTLDGTSTGFDDMYGDAYLLADNSRGGHDTIYGSSGDSLVGDATLMQNNSTGGNDTLIVSAGSDIGTGMLYGDASYLSGTSRGGNDYLQGGDGSEYLYGDAASYDGTTWGGMDTLVGGGGNDILVGGPNDDLFVFASGCGQDVIYDFDKANANLGLTGEHDVIDVRAFGFADWAALSANLFEVDANSTPGVDSTMVTLGEGQVLVVGVLSMTSSDFLWA